MTTSLLFWEGFVKDVQYGGCAKLHPLVDSCQHFKAVQLTPLGPLGAAFKSFA